MPRGVAKAKDGGVDKKKSVVKKDGVKKDGVKRGRKMKGGGGFKEKCSAFFDTYKDDYNTAIKYIDTKLTELILEAKDGKDVLYYRARNATNTHKLRLSVINSIIKIENEKIYKIKYEAFTENMIRIAYEDLYDLLNNINLYEEKKITPKIKDDEKFYKNIIFCKIFTLMLDFKYLCSIDNIGNINIAEDVATSSAVDVDLAAEKDAVSAELATANAAKKQVDAELATEKEAKKAVDAELVAEKEAMKAVQEEFAAEKEAKKAVDAELTAAEEKYKILDDKIKLLEENILTIDEDYFNNAYENAKKKYMDGKDFEGNKILDNITAIWEMLKDNIDLKTNKKIDDIIKIDIPKLKKNYNVAPDWLNKGGKRKINSSRTKRK
jgi:hypothetical protein